MLWKRKLGARHGGTCLTHQEGGRNRRIAICLSEFHANEGYLENPCLKITKFKRKFEHPD